MNVRKGEMVVLSHVQIQLEAMSAPALLAIAYPVRIVDAVVGYMYNGYPKNV